MHNEPGAPERAGADLDPAAVQPGVTLDDGQPQPDTVALRRATGEALDAMYAVLDPRVRLH